MTIDECWYILDYLLQKDQSDSTILWVNLSNFIIVEQRKGYNNSNENNNNNKNSNNNDDEGKGIKIKI